MTSKRSYQSYFAKFRRWTYKKPTIIGPVLLLILSVTTSYLQVHIFDAQIMQLLIQNIYYSFHNNLYLLIQHLLTIYAKFVAFFKNETCRLLEHINKPWYKPKKNLIN